MNHSISSDDLKFHLRSELSRRCRANEQYSLRAFARALDLDPSSVSQILSGKRQVSPRMISKICAKIGWPAGTPERAQSHDYFLLSEDVFAAVSDWYHYALLDLTLLKSFKNDPGWIARKLGISKSEAQMAIDRLQRLGMLIEKNKNLVKGKSHYANYVDGQTSAAHKEYQRQIVRKALAAIDSCSQDEKDITCITIAADSKRLAQAREKIRRFRRELCDFLEAGPGDSVHVLAVQLFPLTRADW